MVSSDMSCEMRSLRTRAIRKYVAWLGEEELDASSRALQHDFAGGNKPGSIQIDPLAARRPPPMDVCMTDEARDAGLRNIHLLLALAAPEMSLLGRRPVAVRQQPGAGT